MIKQFYLPIDWTLTGSTSLDSIDPRVMPMKMYSAFLKVPGLEPHHQLQFSVMPRNLVLVIGEILSLSFLSLSLSVSLSLSLYIYIYIYIYEKSFVVGPKRENIFQNE